MLKKTMLWVCALVIGIALSACATTGTPQIPTVFNQPCSIYKDIGATPTNSFICKKIKNPCAVQTVLATVAKAPLIWEQDRYAELFEKWAGKVQAVIEEGVTYAQLQEIVLIEIAKLNKEAGMALLMASGSIFVFNGQTSPIGEVDRRLLLMSLVDLRAQVQRMSLIVAREHLQYGYANA